MKTTTILFILTILGILSLYLIGTIQKPIIFGEIESIEKTTITKINLKNSNTTIIAFEIIPNLQKENFIEVYGKLETYQNRQQIIAEKINCIDC